MAQQKDVSKIFILAGSESTGAAGLQTDLRTCTTLGVYGVADITCIVSFDPKNNYAHRVEFMKPETIYNQFEAANSVYDLNTIKIGMLGNTESIKVASRILQENDWKHVVVDPVLICKGQSDDDALEIDKALIKEIIPSADIITPNLFEAEKLSGIKITDKNTCEFALKKISELGVDNIVLKLGDRLDYQSIKDERLVYWGFDSDYESKYQRGDTHVDVLYSDNKITYYIHPHLKIMRPISGCGCTLSTAIASNLELGLPYEIAVSRSLKYISEAIENHMETNAPFDSINQL